jgi:DNA-binding NarL/FixJ family response regulator
MHRRAITSGAVGIVLKEQASEVLLKAIARVHEGEVWVDRSMMSEVLAAFTSGRGNADPEQEKIDSLTEREREVIDLIAKGMKNQQIADALFISESTVRRHLSSIFTKLDVTDRLELLIYTLQHGVIAPPSRG